MMVRIFEERDSDAVVALWEACGLTRPWNNPHLDIQRKVPFQPDLFFVGEIEGAVGASAMFGYDGHRGWLYYFAVRPDHQGKGYSKALLHHGEAALLALGCPKINFQVRADNHEAIAYYLANGYTQDDVLSYGKRLIVDGSKG